MEITEEVGRRQKTIKIEDTTSIYSRFKQFLQTQMQYEKVIENEYRENVEKENIVAEIETKKQIHKFTSEIIKIKLEIDSEESELTIKIKSFVETSYPEDHIHQKTIWYYMYRSVYDKFLYGSVRQRYTSDIEDNLENLVEEIIEQFQV